jgi:hypothetical protein
MGSPCFQDPTYAALVLDATDAHDRPAYFDTEAFVDRARCAPGPDLGTGRCMTSATRWLVVLTTLVMAAGCGDDDLDLRPTPTPTATTSATPTVERTPTPAPSECDCFPLCLPVTCEPVAVEE